MATAEELIWRRRLEELRSARRPGAVVAIRALSRHRLALVCAVIVAIYVLIAIVGPLLSPYSYADQNLSQARMPPLSPGHLLGTDELGRDLLSRLLTAIRVSMGVGVGTTALAVAVGLPAGIVAGYYRGRLDTVLNGLFDLVWGYPLILVAVIVIGAMGPGLKGVVIAVAFINWAGLARIVRADVLSLGEREFVLGARALGKSDVAIMVEHLLPNLLGSVLVMTSYYVAVAIIAEAGLSFIGMGAQQPLPSLGNMVAEGSQFMLVDHWISTLPGVLLTLLVLALNVLGDGVRDILDPRLRVER